MTIVKHDLQKLENLINSATNARQRKMYESLLAKARTKYQKVEPAPQPEKEPVPEIKPEAKVTSPAKSKQISKQVKEKKGKQQKQKTEKVTQEEIQVAEPKATKKGKSRKTPAEQPEDTLLHQKEKTEKVSRLSQEKDRHLFQAVGLIRCSPKIKDDNLYITVDGKNYDLRRGQFQARKCFDKLKREIIENGSRKCRLIVYPKIAHNLAEDKIYSWFSLVREIPDNSPREEDFVLRGIWQQVNHCTKPVISIYRNIKMLHLYKKASTPAAKKAFARSQDFPVVWSAPIEPFRYNSKLKNNEQMPRYFVQVKAIFKDGQFHVTEALEEPTLDIPKHINPLRKNAQDQKKS